MHLTDTGWGGGRALLPQTGASGSGGTPVSAMENLQIGQGGLKSASHWRLGRDGGKRAPATFPALLFLPCLSSLYFFNYYYLKKMDSGGRTSRHKTCNRVAAGSKDFWIPVLLFGMRLGRPRAPGPCPRAWVGGFCSYAHHHPPSGLGAQRIAWWFFGGGGTTELGSCGTAPPRVARRCSRGDRTHSRLPSRDWSLPEQCTFTQGCPGSPLRHEPF